MKGIDTFKKDHGNQTSSCSPWGLQVHPFPSLVKKMEIYWEERRNIADSFHLAHTYPNRPIISPFTKPQTPRKKNRDSKRSRKVNHQVNNKQYKVQKLEESFSLSKAAMPTLKLAFVLTTYTATTTTATLPVPSKPPSTLNTPTIPKPQEHVSPAQL